ncbi:MAG: hypothetical protein EAX96_12025 [Candidatus Lokiarchaeota archaeon]|nr:hypothetical protein [Candidatus Lokiarchaeota archaeon]
MYLLKDVRSFTYKLTPVISNENINAELRDHKIRKSLKIQDFKTFERKHVHEYKGLEHRLLRDPKLLASIPEDENLARIYLKKVKMALNLIYIQKNKLNDAIYNLRKRNKFILSAKKQISKNLKETLLKFYNEDFQAFQEIAEFIKNFGLNILPLPLHQLDSSFIANSDFQFIARESKTRMPAINSLRNLLKTRIQDLKEIKNRIKKLITYHRFPEQTRVIYNEIMNKIDYNFFLNRWMTNHFILHNFNLETITKIRNSKNNNSYNRYQNGDFTVLFRILRTGFSSKFGTVQILHNYLGTPEHLEDRRIRNSLVLAGDILKSQEKHMKLFNEINDYFMENITELNAFLQKNRQPFNFYKIFEKENYFYIQGLFKEYKNNLKNYLSILKASEIKSITSKEISIYFRKVFERLFYYMFDLFLAHRSSKRTYFSICKSYKLYEFLMSELKITSEVDQIIKNELNQINFDCFINEIKNISLHDFEKLEFIKILRWALTCSFLLNKIKTQDNSLFKVTRNDLIIFKENLFLRGIPLLKRDVIIHHGDGGERLFDDEWKLHKKSGYISEIIDYNKNYSKKLKFRLKLLDENKIWRFQEFQASCPELENWFKFNQKIKEFLEEVLITLNCQKEGKFYLHNLDLKNFKQKLALKYNKFEKQISDDFQKHIFRQLKRIILERYEQYKRDDCEDNFNNFCNLFLEKIETPILNKLIKNELKNVQFYMFGSLIQEKIRVLNKQNLPLTRINITQLKKIFRAHLNECPKIIKSKFDLYQIKNYVIQKKHLLRKSKNKFLLIIPIEISIPIEKRNSQKITGVDWGIRTDLSASLFDFSKLIFENDLQIDESETWDKILNNRDNFARLQRVKVYLEKDFLKMGKFFKPISTLISNHGFKNNRRISYLAHLLSKRVIDWSIKNNSRIIAVESLKSLKLERGKLTRLLNFRINHSPRALLRELIDLKIRRFGGKLYNVNARYTSQYSSILILKAIQSNKKLDKWYGNTTKGYRTNTPTIIPPPKEKGGEYFYHNGLPIINADINAAQNIALKMFHHFN